MFNILYFLFPKCFELTFSWLGGQLEERGGPPLLHNYLDVAVTLSVASK